MAADLERIKRLGTAAAFCLFDSKLRSSGNSSITWGLLNLVIGLAAVIGGSKWGLVSLILGAGLVAAGLYERTVRDPKVIIMSAATLAFLALWEFALIGLAAAGKVHLVMGGRTLFWAIAQAWGALATWKTYSTYKMLHEQSDPMTVQQVRGYIDELKKAKPAQTVDVIEFDANAGFVEGTKRYRLKPVDDLFVAARYKSQLRSLQLEEVIFLPRTEVTLTPEGGTWMSKKIKAIVQLGPLRLDKVTITPDMAERINPAARVMALGNT